LPIEDPKLDNLRPGFEGNGKRSLRRPKLSTKGSSAPGRRRGAALDNLIAHS